MSGMTDNAALADSLDQIQSASYGGYERVGLPHDVRHVLQLATARLRGDGERTVWGMPIVLDESLAPDEFRVVPQPIAGDSVRTIEVLQAIGSAFDGMPAPCEERDAIAAAIAALSTQPAPSAPYGWIVSGPGGTHFIPGTHAHVKDSMDTPLAREVGVSFVEVYTRLQPAPSERSDALEIAEEDAALSAPSEQVAASETGLPDRDPARPNSEQGLYRKFDVRRADGSDAPGGKHEGCEYFVLDLTHDPFARIAASAYAAAAEASHPDLAADMREQYGLAAASVAPERED